MKFLFPSLALLLSLTLAQYGNPNPKSSSTIAAAPTAAAAAQNTIHTIAVGENGFVFTPNTLKASPGDILQFSIAVTHSVARSAFNTPCQALGGASAIWSGFSTTNNELFSVTVNDTQPIWLYCAQVGHCQGGMAMVVNPAASGPNTLQAYLTAAKSSSSSSHAVNIAGGVFGKAQLASSPSASASGSGSGTSASATSAGAAATSPAAGTGGAGRIVGNLLLGAGVLAGAGAFVL